MKLHGKVSMWVREYLQAEVHRKSKDVRELNQRGVKYLRERLAKIESDTLVLIENRCDDNDWVRSTIELTYHLFWLDEVDAWRWFIPRFVEALAYSNELQYLLVEAANDQKNCLSSTGRTRLKALSPLAGRSDDDDEKPMLDG